MELVTGHSGSDHVDSTDAGAMHAGIVGTGTYVLGTGGRLVATMQSANVVRIADGDLMMQGRHATIEAGAYDELTIQNGTQAQKRNDLVVAHYERKTSAPYTESLDLRVIKGTPTSGSPTDPEYQEGDILAGDAVVEAPLYRITLDGITVGEPVPLFDVLLPMADLWDSVSQIPYVDYGVSDSTNGLGVAVCTPEPPSWAPDRMPDYVLCSLGPTGTSVEAQAKLFSPVIWSIDAPRQFQLRLRREDTHDWATNQAIRISWAAVWLPG